MRPEISLLFLTLLSTSIAYPSNLTLPSSNTTLSERGILGQMPWIGSVDPSDVACKTNVLEATKHDRPKIPQDGTSYDCQEFHREGSRNIKIYWGTQGKSINEVSVFDGRGCGDKDYAKVFSRDGKEEYSCIDMRGDKRPWMSARGGWH